MAIPAPLSAEERRKTMLPERAPYFRVGHSYIPADGRPTLPPQERHPFYFDRRQKCRRRNHRYAEHRIRNEASFATLNADYRPFSILPIYDDGAYREGFKSTLDGSTIELDVNGDPVWVESEPSGSGKNHNGAGTRKIHYDETAGDDTTGDGTVESPYKSPSVALSWCRDGYPDWCLAKSGETWTHKNFGQIAQKGGRSANEPMLLGTYGEGDAPLFKLDHDQGICSVIHLGGDPTATGADCIAISGLTFYNYKRDPDNVDYNSDYDTGGEKGLSSVIRWNWWCIHDCELKFTATGISFQGDTGDRIFILNHTTIHHCYKKDADASGLYMKSALGLHIDYCVFDHNGWNATIDPPNNRNHNIYAQGAFSGPSPTGVTVNNVYMTDTITARAAGVGIQARFGVGGVNNLHLANAIAGFFTASADETPAFWNRCVVLHGVTHTGVGNAWGIHCNTDVAGAEVSDSIVAHSQIALAAFGYKFGEGSSGPPNSILSNCVLFKWPTNNPKQLVGEASLDVDDLLVDQGTDNIHGFSDPNRTMLTYAQNILELDVDTLQEAIDAVMAGAVVAVRKKTRNDLYLAPAINSYIREGFDMLLAEPEAPTVTTGAVENLDHESVTLNGTVTDVGGSPMIRRGYVWGASENPVVDVDATIEKGGSLGPITPHHLEGLTDETSLHYRAFAENGVNISYGADVPFTTLAASSSHVQITNNGTVWTGKTQADVSFEVTDDAGHTITEIAVVWNLLGSPTIADNKVVAEGTSEGEYLVRLTGLTGGQPIFWRPAVTSSDGGGHTDYGPQGTFNTDIAIKKKLTVELA